MVARARAQALAAHHPFHDCYSLAFSSWIQLKIGDLAAAAEDASRLYQQASLYGLHALRALGRTLGGVIEASMAEDPRDGLGDTMAGLGEWQASGSELLACYFYTEAANIWLRGGDARHARIELDKAFEIARKTREGYYAAEMHRLSGEIKCLGTKNLSGAEADFRTALDVATAQDSLTFQLRAATSLLRVSRARTDLALGEKKRRIAKYREVLASVLRSFDGQPEYADLLTARGLLAAGSGNP